MNAIDRIIDIMGKSNITVTELCKATGISDGNFSNWRKRGSTPSTLILTKIADYLETSVDYLINGSNENTEKELPKINPKALEIMKLCENLSPKQIDAVMANDIIKGKQEMTLQEARIIRLLVTQVVKEDKDLKTYVCRIQDLADFLGVTSQTLYRDIRTICKNLLKSTVEIGTGNPQEPWVMFQWVQKAEYDSNGNITLMLSEQIKPYVLELERWFTQYPIGNILSMRSYYAIRMYELLKCESGVARSEKDYHEFSIGFLRSYFCCENKFERISAFKEYVIETAIREINEKTDIYADTEYIKTGREVTSVKFWMHSFNLFKAVLK